ncbi:MAG: glycoside hydrolase family 2 protein [Puniceicoccaceae bacterium]
MKRIFFFTTYLFCSVSLFCAWQPVKDVMLTEFGEKVTPENAWTEYPRPQMVREEWQNLNGLWELAIMGKPTKEWTGGRIENHKASLLNTADKLPADYNREILVPFSPETALSGVGEDVRPDQYLAYRRTFSVPKKWNGKRIILNFEAVDWHSVVYVNGSRVGEHKGGYVPFSFDITEYLQGSTQKLEVYAWDPTNFGDQSVGKQALPENRIGFRYTPNSGIYGSVWLEPVAASGIKAIRATPDLNTKSLQVAFDSWEAKSSKLKLEVRLLDGKEVKAQYVGPYHPNLSLKVNGHVKAWSIENPFLYDLDVRLIEKGKVIDSIKSYVGMRSIEIGDGPHGKQVLLNGKPVFQYGPLDQGYWPGSALTPPSDEAAFFDLKYLKDIGCNFVRVHIKTHPRRWYYHADKLGLLIWQDLVCSRKFDKKITKQSGAQWEDEQWRMMEALHNHPSIIMWIVFNESWGQYDTVRLTKVTKSMDPSRLVTGVSGWTDYAVGDIFDLHDYSFYPTFGHGSSTPERASLLGECGGNNLYIKGHLWPSAELKPRSITGVTEKGRDNWDTIEDMNEQYPKYVQQLALLREMGMNGAVYTQITDVEHECNGWLTYDRKVSKLPVERLKDIHSVLYQKEPLGSAIFDTNTLNSWKPLTDPEQEGPQTVSLDINLKSKPNKPIAIRFSGHGLFKFYLNGTLVSDLRVVLAKSADAPLSLPVTSAILTDEAVKQLKAGKNKLKIEITPSNSRRTFDLKPTQLKGEVLLGRFELLELNL